MKRLGVFLKDKRGTSFEGVALSVSIVAVAFVASADLLDYMTKANDSSKMNDLSKTMVSLNSSMLPSTETGDLGRNADGIAAALASRTLLDPCTGRVK